MAFGSISSWQIDGEKMETVTEFIFWGSKITADGDCSHEIKRCLLLGRKAMTNLDSILKSRDITLLIKVYIDKAITFPVVIYGCESWTIQKAEHGRIDALRVWCWRRLLRVPWTSRRSNQSIPRKLILNIPWKNWCWSWSSNTLATWCKEPSHWKRSWCWERLKAGGEGGDRIRCWMASLTQWTWVWANSGSWWWTGRPGMLQSMGLQELDISELLNNKNKNPSGVSSKESTCQCRRCKRHGFDPWVGKMPCSRKWQPTPIFLPRRFHGQRSLVGYSPWSRTE